MNIKNDIVDVFRRSSAVADSRATDLKIEIQRQIEERNRIESKLKEASRESGYKKSDVFFLIIEHVLLYHCRVMLQ